ncbi:MAG: C10 family peptidase, partial [Candidatus Delongbacteria bacterium]|nr:C10 family peptidase [Candidatus Delongbacteria bacterium]
MVLVVCAVLSAAVVPIDRAQKVAENYYLNYAPVALRDSKVQKVLTKEYLGQPTWYVFAFDKGWIIVAAEDNVRPVLGYSFTSPIDEDLYNMNNPFLKRFSAYDKQIVHSIREKEVVVLNKQREWKDIENNVFPQSSAKSAKGPLMQDLFSQGYPFNNACPGGSVVGCVATSFTQIMRYWEGPATGPTILSNSDTAGDVQASYTIPVSERIYDWTLMQGLKGIDFDTQEELDEIGKLSLHTGISVDMNWEVDESSALNSLTNIINNWSFTGALFTNVGTVTDSTAQTLLIQTEINAMRPIMWGGYGDDGGHAFVLDGYNVDALNHKYDYHFNWGWGGAYNGWFMLNDLSPGVSSFSEGQDAFYNLEVDGFAKLRPAATNLVATPNSSGDMTLTWTAPDVQAGDATLVDYNIFKDDAFLGSVGSVTETYVDPALPEGQYKYVVRAVYTGPDGSSFPSNEAYGSIIPDPAYPAPIAFTATSYRYNRQKIDLTWTKPFTGTELWSDGFEVGNSQASLPAGWIQRGSFQLDEPGMTWHVPAGVPGDDQGFVCSVTTAHTGTLSLLANDWATLSEYFYCFTPQITLEAGKGMMTFWYLSEKAGTRHHIVLYNGDFTESDASPYLTVVKSDIEFDFDPGENVWVGQQYVDLSSYSGTYYIGLVKEQTEICANRYDDFFFGSDTYPLPALDQPTDYEIYRDGAIIATVPCTGILSSYEDNDFVDGWNNYYARAIYPGDHPSISGPKSSAFIVSNPVPVALAGSYDEVNEEVDLSWYSPGHYPIHWFGWEYENDDWYYLYYDQTAGGEVYSARTQFSDIAFDMCYNVYLDSISCAFYEDEVDQPWVSNQFRFAIGTGAGREGDTLHTSPILTAVPGEFYDYDIPGIMTMTGDWWVEVQFIDLTSATPTPMSLVHEEGVGVHFNSTWHWEGDASNPDGFYEWVYLSPYECEDWAIYCLGYNDAPTITKTSPSIVTQNDDFKTYSKDLPKPYVKVNDVYDSGVKAIKPNGRKKIYPMYSDNIASKALQTYQIWRNDTRYATSTSTTYTDIAPLPSNIYYITAIYNDPAGESEATNEITLGPPAYAQMPVNITKTVPSGSSDTGTFNLGNTGDGYLNYTLSYEYTDTMTQPQMPVDEHFASSLGTFTSSANWAYSTTTPTYETGYARMVSINNATRSGYLTSQTFDVSALNGTTLSYAYLWNGNGTTTYYMTVEYSTDGSNYTQLARYDATDQLTWATVSHSIPANTVNVRFYAYFNRVNGLYAGVDVIQVTGDEYLIDPWFSFVSAVEGTVLDNSSNTITCGYNATNLPDGEYHANVIVDSNDEVNPQIVTPVVLTVSNGGGPVIPAVPANLVTSVVGGQVVLNWDDSADATEYYIYSSADPYGTYS